MFVPRRCVWCRWSGAISRRWPFSGEPPGPNASIYDVLRVAGETKPSPQSPAREARLPHLLHRGEDIYACLLRSLLDDENVVVVDPDREALEQALVISLRTRHDDLAALFARNSGHWSFEDPVYRFYHQSFKVFELQSQTTKIVDLLGELLPGRPLNTSFMAIVASEVTRPILEAFFHARFFLEMAVRYSDLESPPMPLPSGYAALLYLYDLR